MDGGAIQAWLDVLDRLSYYEILGVDPKSGADTIRQGFYSFALNFHPDSHATRPASERRAINTIFKRGTEAYRVLSDMVLRAHYDDSRATGGAPARMMSAPPRSAAKPSVLPPSMASPPSNDPTLFRGRLEDFVKQARARPFAQKAEELAKKNDFGKAKLQLKLAISMDPGNAALESYLKELDAKIAQAKKTPGA